jgi:hypothetical protein
MPNDARPLTTAALFLAAIVLAACLLYATGWPAAGSETPATTPADSTTDVGVAASPTSAHATAARIVAVRVLDAEDESPLAGARVAIRRGGDEAPQEVARGDTARDGAAKLRIPAETETFDLLVRAAGHVHEWRQEVGGGDANEEFVVRLERAGRVRGVVRGADGRPADGVEVHAEIENHAGWPDDEAVVTADGGRYEIDGIEVGAGFTVTAADAGRIASRQGFTVTAPGETVTADLTLAAAAKLVVRVLWSDGLPVEGASVELQPSGDQAESDDAGRAAFGALVAGKHHVVAQRAGFADAEADVELAPGEERILDLRPVPNAVLSGVVVDDAGFPVAGAAVAVDGQSPPRARTIADGRFRIACDDDDAHDLVVSEEAHCDATVAGVAAPSEDLRIVLARRPKVRCRLVPPAGAVVPQRADAWWDGRSASCAVEDGVLTILVSPGGGRVSFQVQGFVVFEHDVDAEPGETVDLGDVPLVVAPKLTGRVVDEKGAPVDAFVYATVGGAQAPLTSTDAGGAFAFDGLPPGDAELRAEAKGFVQRTIRYAFGPGAAPATIVLVRGGAVKGRVLDADGNPAPMAVYVSFADRDDPQNRDRQAFPVVAEDGTFELRLLPGRYTARTTLDDREGSAEVVVVEGETRDVTITIPAK